MKGFLYIVLFMLLAVVCWGVYAPLLGASQKGMEGSALRPFICVGAAYFAVAVVLPIFLLKSMGERGHWSTTGVLWSAVAGAGGAVGALAVILALKNGGKPIYVMPIVFGGAPVVNSILTIYFAKAYKQVGPIFIAGLIVVLVGSATVMLFRPLPPTAAAPPPAAVGTSQAAAPQAAAPPWTQMALVCAFTTLAALAWGSYGPTLHKGQVAMAGSRLRPFLCVGLMYFLIAVCVPTLWLSTAGEIGEFKVAGILWGLIGGATGALGAMGIIMAFNMGAKPVYLMPLVFGGAPVVNTLVSVAQTGGTINPIFIAGLILTVAGAATVLVFAPRSHPLAAVAEEKSPHAEHDPQRADH